MDSPSEDLSMSGMAVKICEKIAAVFSQPSEPYDNALDTIVAEIARVANSKGKVFFYGAGRGGLMLKALCMRLVHLGISAHFVLDITSPPITPCDLLFVSSGRGTSETVELFSKIAKEKGARVLLLTAQPDGSDAREADVVAYLPAQNMSSDQVQHGDGFSKNKTSLLPLGSAYEGAMFILFEMTVYRLSDILDQSPEMVRSRHANLE